MPRSERASLGERLGRSFDYGGACLCCRHLMGDDTAVNKLSGFEWMALAVATVGVVGSIVALVHLAGSL